MPKCPWIPGAVALAMVVGMIPAQADDLTGANKLLCSAVQATACTLEEDCLVGAPWNWNIPQFIEVDLQAKTLSTTKASGENRTSPIKYVERTNGLIIFQGVEAGRAFSFVITEATGFAAVAVAREGVTVGVFGMCTPSK
jgi:hypothetical protein